MLGVRLINITVMNKNRTVSAFSQMIWVKLIGWYAAGFVISYQVMHLTSCSEHSQDLVVCPTAAQSGQ